MSGTGISGARALATLGISIGVWFLILAQYKVLGTKLKLSGLAYMAGLFVLLELPSAGSALRQSFGA